MQDNKHPEIQTLLASSLETDGVRLDVPFGFYWTRKSPAIAKSLIENFSKGNSVIMDPFLGSGTTAIGSLHSGANRLFVGVELNELPLENLKFTIKPDIQRLEIEVSSIQEVIESTLKLYRLQLGKSDFEISKLVFDSNESSLFPISFEGVLNNSQLIKIADGHELFELALEAYAKKLATIPVREAKELAPNSRIAIGIGMDTSDPFSPLNFETLFQMREISRANKTAQLLLASCLHLCKLTDAKSQSQFPYWKPKLSIHEKAAPLVLRKYLDLLISKAKSGLATSGTHIFENFDEWRGGERGGLLLIKGPTQSALKNTLTDESVDLVITDPPYFDQVAYSEYLKLYEYFTHFNSELEDEIVQSSRTGAGKTRDTFLRELGLAFEEIRRVMKTGSLALVYFKDSKPKNLHDFIQTLESKGLRFLTQAHLPKSTFTYKQNTSKESTVGGDSIMVFLAGSPVDDDLDIGLSKVESEKLFLELFEGYLKAHGPTSLTEALDNGLIVQLYRAGALSSLSNSSFFFDSASKIFDYDAATRKWKTKA